MKFPNIKESTHQEYVSFMRNRALPSLALNLSLISILIFCNRFEYYRAEFYLNFILLLVGIITAIILEDGFYRYLKNLEKSFAKRVGYMATLFFFPFAHLLTSIVVVNKEFTEKNSLRKIIFTGLFFNILLASVFNYFGESNVRNRFGLSVLKKSVHPSTAFIIQTGQEALDLLAIKKGLRLECDIKRIGCLTEQLQDFSTQGHTATGQILNTAVSAIATFKEKNLLDKVDGISDDDIQRSVITTLFNSSFQFEKSYCAKNPIDGLMFPLALVGPSSLVEYSLLRIIDENVMAKYIRTAELKLDDVITKAEVSEKFKDTGRDLRRSIDDFNKSLCAKKYEMYKWDLD